MEKTEHNRRVDMLLCNMFAKGKIPHAFALVSEEYIDAAKNIAASILCEKRCFPPCGVCRHCQKIKKGIHPDLIEIAPLKGKVYIGVDTIRQLRSDAYIRPNDASAKVYFINGAALMNEAAQNALLKILEQPPENVYFILGDKSVNDLLPTVLSRVTLFSLDGEKVKEKAKYADKVNEILKAYKNRDEAGMYLLLSSLPKREQMICLYKELNDSLYEKIRSSAIKGAPDNGYTVFFDKLQDAMRRLENAGNPGIIAASLASELFGGK